MRQRSTLQARNAHQCDSLIMLHTICRSTGQLAALHRGAHGKPWSRLLPPGGSGATGAAGAASRPQPQSTGVAAVVFHDPQGRASLQVTAQSLPMMGSSFVVNLLAMALFKEPSCSLETCGSGSQLSPELALKRQKAA